MNKKEVKILISKILKFVIILLVIDFTLGSFAKYIFFSQETGKYARINYSINETKDEILIFGSSRANRHYIPDIFEKRLNLKCYNTGVQGQRILFQSALQQLILERANPKLIILNIDANWLYKSNEAYDRLSDLHPYYWKHRKTLKPILKLQSNFIDFKLFFKSYQMNSTIIHALKYYYSPQIDYKGYRPLTGEMKQAITEQNNIKNKPEPVNEQFDNNFINALNAFINNAKNKEIELIFVVSPTPNGADYTNNKSMTKILDIAISENITVFDFSNDAQFVNQFNLFYDSVHLNDKGAQLFSELLCDKIKNIK